MAWTSEQQKAIDEKDSCILVSAAAGSGKTAVLVERIVQQIIDKDNPRGIDEFLVVTFTNSAASQMRDKIAAKLETILEENPENEHLMKQLLLINQSDITTIDSFCLRLVKEYFSLLDMDSTFSIGDMGMMELLKNDVLDRLFDEKYKSRAVFSTGASFSELVDIFCDEKDDSGLKDEILRLHRMANSYPKPHEWLCNARKALDINTEEDFNDLPWIKLIISAVHNRIPDIIDIVNKGLELCYEAGGPDKNIEVVESDIKLIEKISEAKTYEEMKNAMTISWVRLKVCNSDQYDQELVEKFKKIRTNYKKIIDDLNVFSKPVDEVLEQISITRRYLQPLIDLTIEFSDTFYEVKRSKKLMEFPDIEHMAYKLVCAGYDSENRPIPTAIGKQISERYKEIYIDEYQDSNYLQEDILCSVSGICEGNYNMFMVGDIKQSIYRFRMARPDLFIEKYNRFSETGDEIKIELSNNFRSRAVVLEAVNYFFYQLMGADLGGVAYDKKVALVPSKKFLDSEALSISTTTEVLVANYKEKDDDKEKDDSKEKGEDDIKISTAHANLNKLQLEANMIADRILEIIDPDDGMYIFDEEEEIYRRAEYRDIVILGRNIKGFGDIIYNELTSRGIPVYLEDPTGYFDAVEIKLIMSLLSVIDNSRQDIPFAAVLLSPMAELDENDLAVVTAYIAREHKKVKSLYDKCILYIEDNNDDISDKLSRIINIINMLKKEKMSMSISKLIWKCLDVTGYYTYAQAMPMGEKRKANIDMLLEKADKFEDGYYKGVFNFLRYIEKLKINDVDFGEANILGDNENVVRIISMHKSKGLEYPIVFVSGLGKNFNKTDTKKNLIVHSDYYLASRLIMLDKRYKKESFMHDVFKTLLHTETMAEELRILYVAMTRAKEKLILTGCENDVEKLLDKLSDIEIHKDILLPYSKRMDSDSFMQLIIAGLVRYKELIKRLDIDNIIEYKVYSYGDIVSRMSTAAISSGIELETFVERALTSDNEDLYNRFKASFEYTYPYERLTKIKSKMSISEIKKMKAFDGNDYDIAEVLDDKNKEAVAVDEDDLPKKENILKIEDILKKDTPLGALTGSERGTIVHKFMELLPFSDISQDAVLDEFVSEFKNKLLKEGIFDERESGAINEKKITSMLASSLGSRMIKAAKEGKLYKEQQFSVGIPAADIYTEEELMAKDLKDVVIVQGIIDAFFYEDNQIVLMDYKTDRADNQELFNLYHAQLSYYAETLEKLTGCTVKEKLIYSFYLNEVIEINVK